MNAGVEQICENTLSQRISRITSIMELVFSGTFRTFREANDFVYGK